MAAGLAAIALATFRRGSPAIAFNLTFGAIDLWQAVAGPLGWFPSAAFGLKPADHVVHAILGPLFVGVGSGGASAVRVAGLAVVSPSRRGP